MTLSAFGLEIKIVHLTFITSSFGLTIASYLYAYLVFHFISFTQRIAKILNDPIDPTICEVRLSFTNSYEINRLLNSVHFVKSRFKCILLAD